MDPNCKVYMYVALFWLIVSIVVWVKSSFLPTGQLCTASATLQKQCKFLWLSTLNNLPGVPKKHFLRSVFLGTPCVSDQYQTSIIQIFWSLVAKNNIMFHSKHLILKTGWHKKWLFQENFLNIFEKISKIVWIFGIWHSFYKICKINTNQNNIKDVLFESHWAVISFFFIFFTST